MLSEQDACHLRLASDANSSGMGLYYPSGKETSCDKLVKTGFLDWRGFIAKGPSGKRGGYWITPSGREALEE